MIQQLGPSTFFVTFTSTEILSDPFIKVLHTLHATRLNHPNKLKNLQSYHITKLVQTNLICRNPNLAKCGGEAQHLEIVGIWSPPGLPNVQSSTARGKTPRIGVFLVSLERS
jgi:hypothetical protein